MPDNAPEAEARQFAAQFSSFLDWIHATNREDRSEVSTLISGFLGRDGAAQSVVTRELAPFEHVNLQAALDAWSARPGRTVEVRGLTLPPHHATPTLQQLVAGDDERVAAHPARPHRPAERPQLDPRLPQARAAARHRRPIAASSSWSAEPDEHDHRPRGRGRRPAGRRRPAGTGRARRAPVRSSTSTAATCSRSRSPRWAGSASASPPRPGSAATTWCCRTPCSARIERHALGVAEHRAALLAAGQHLKRGLLLYGPPGTGKTHTTRYLLGQMTGYTRLVLTGRALVARRRGDRDGPRARARGRWSSRTWTWSPRSARWGRGPARSCSTCSTRWTARPATPTCSSCSPPTGPTCSSSRWRRARAGSTSRSRSRCPTRPPGSGCSRSTAGACRWS